MNPIIGEAQPGLELSDYEGYYKKSSSLEVDITGGFLLKKKKRKPAKAVHEFVAMESWRRLLEESKLGIKSPRPICAYENGNILMELCEGYTGQHTLNRLPGTKRERRDIKTEYVGRVAQLMSLKIETGLCHGDFQLRHVLHNPGGTSTVIDVEGTNIPEEVTLVDEEHNAFIKELRIVGNAEIVIPSSIPGSRKKEIDGIVADVCRDFGLNVKDLLIKKI